jgi:peptide deformylase
MALRRVLRIDDPEDKAILQTPCEPIKLPDRRLKQLIEDMFETMHTADGVGLAAPQIGLSIQLTVIETPALTDELEDGTEIELEPAHKVVLINPRIVKTSGEEIMRQEGCLSLPEWYGEVPRQTWVTVEYQEPNGKRRRLRKAGGFLGWVIQHEVDHLHGVLFTERIRDMSTLHKAEPAEEQQAAEADHTESAPQPAEHVNESTSSPSAT